MPTRKLPWLSGKEVSDGVRIEKVMAQLAADTIRSNAHQHRHPFIVDTEQRFIGVDIDDFHRQANSRRHRLQRVQHVVAQVAVRAGIQDEMGQYEAAEDGGVPKRRTGTA